MAEGGDTLDFSFITQSDRLLNEHLEQYGAYDSQPNTPARDEYSPSILSSQENVKADDNPASQCAPQSQEFYEKIRKTLQNEPKKTYISKIISLCNANEIEWYRMYLAQKAQTFNQCPRGRLMTRKNSSISSVKEKMANDCYILTAFNNEIQEYLADQAKVKQRIQTPTC